MCKWKYSVFEGLFTTLIIDPMEGRHTYFFDVPGAYLHAEMPKKIVLMKLRGYFVDIMCEVNPEHKNDTVYKNGKKVYTYEWSDQSIDALSLHCYGMSYIVQH